MRMSKKLRYNLIAQLILGAVAVIELIFSSILGVWFSLAIFIMSVLLGLRTVYLIATSQTLKKDE